MKILSVTTISIAIILLLSLVGIDVLLTAFMLAIVVLNSLLAELQKIKAIPSNLQLTTFSIVVVAMATRDIKIAIFYSLIPNIAAAIYTKMFSLDNILAWVSHIMVAVISYILRDFNLIYVGIGISLLDLIVMWISRKKFLGLDFTANAISSLTRFIFNCMLFLIFGRFLNILL